MFDSQISELGGKKARAVLHNTAVSCVPRSGGLGFNLCSEARLLNVVPSRFSLDVLNFVTRKSLRSECKQTCFVSWITTHDRKLPTYSYQLAEECLMCLVQLHNSKHFLSQVLLFLSLNVPRTLCAKTHCEKSLCRPIIPSQQSFSHVGLSFFLCGIPSLLSSLEPSLSLPLLSVFSSRRKFRGARILSGRDMPDQTWGRCSRAPASGL